MSKASEVKKHLMKSVKAWHNWDKALPSNVEVICNECAEKYGKFLSVRQWLIIPATSNFRECLVAEINVKEDNKFSTNDYVHIHVNHLTPNSRGRQ